MNRRLLSKLALVLFAVNSATGFCLGGNPPAEPDPDTCHYSDRVYEAMRLLWGDVKHLLISG